ncbi:hypothetical protein N8T08_006157 [Aspergillus melleus]|uniref:Uncharacterized protein n=1 Tax=Aspergillus melleus TaxID=138277 RepID=A0ACC3B0W0_9EURO|nr:hypothetical protein N8T08_006157 [Aspergillus melleus]
MDYNHYKYNAGWGSPQPNSGYPGHPPNFFHAPSSQYDPPYNPYYQRHFHAYGAGYCHQNPSQFPNTPPQFHQPRSYEPPNPSGNEGRIAVTNSNCGRAATSNFGNTTMTNCHNNNQGNHHADNRGRIQTRNIHENRTTRVGDVSSNGGNANANTSRNGFMTNANVRGGTNLNSGYQHGGAGGSVNIGRSD